LAQLLDISAQQVVDVPDEKVTQAVATGRFTLPKGRVEVVTGKGERGTIDAEEAQHAFGNLGYRYATPAELDEERKADTYGDSPVKAGLEGLARGATFGLSDIALGESGAVDKEALRERKERNKAAATVGEVGGMIAPAVLTAGDSLAASAAEALPAAAASTLGRAAEAGVVRALGEGAAARIAGSATSAAVEGGLYGLGHGISEASLGDHELTAEKLFSEVGAGALWGAAGGGAAKALGEGGSALMRKLARTGAKDAGDAGAEAADTLATTSPADAAAPVPGEAAPGAAPAPDVEAEAFDDLPEGFGEPGMKPGERLRATAEKNAGRVQQLLGDFGIEAPSANAYTLKSLRLTQSDITRLRGKNAQGLEELAPELLRKDARFAAARKTDEKLQLVRDMKGEAAGRMQSAAQKFDELATRPGLETSPVSPLDVASRWEDEVLKPLREGPAANGPTASAVEGEIQKLLDKGEGTTFADAEKLKRDLDPYARWDGSTEGAPKAKAYRQLRGILNDEIESKAKGVVDAAGEGRVFKDWKQAKRQWAAMHKLDELATKRLQDAAQETDSSV
jgi:hypothetical protein